MKKAFYWLLAFHIGTAQAQTSFNPNVGDVWTYMGPTIGSQWAPALFPVITTGDLNTYISKTGTNSGDCQSPSRPCLTIAYALSQSTPYATRGNNLVVNFQGAGDWAEDVFINGPVNGGINRSAIPQIGSTWPAMVLLLGNGASNTTVSGTGNTCVTIASSQYAVVGLKNIKITGNKTACQSDVFSQMGDATVHVFGGVEFGAAGANGNILHAEEASIQIWESSTISGGASSALAVSTGGRILHSSGTITISSSPNYPSGFLFGRSGGMIQSNVAQPFGASPVATGPKFNLHSNATFESPITSTALIPGNAVGKVGSGGRVRGPLPASLAGVTGLGSTGTGAMTTGSGGYAGQIVLSPSGAGIASNGSISVTLPYHIINESNALAGFCTVAPSTGTGSWAAGTFVNSGLTQPATGQLAINWANGGGAALTGGLTYSINYNCNGD